MAGPPSNLPASIHQRLLNHAKEQGRPLQELLQYFAIERFLFRLSQSPHATRFYLKGALMLRIWDAPLSRPTIDVDLMGRQMLSQDELEQVIKDVCVQTVPDDGCRFEPATVRAQPIRTEDQYGASVSRSCPILGRSGSTCRWMSDSVTSSSQGRFRLISRRS